MGKVVFQIDVEQSKKSLDKLRSKVQGLTRDFKSAETAVDILDTSIISLGATAGTGVDRLKDKFNILRNSIRANKYEMGRFKDLSKLTGEEVERTANRGINLFGLQFSRSIGAAGLALLSIHKTSQEIRKNYETILEMSSAKESYASGSEDAINTLQRNMLQLSDKDQDKIRKFVVDFRRRKGADINQIRLLMAEALSTQGGDPDLAAKVLEGGFSFVRTQPIGGAKEAIGALGDIKRIGDFKSAEAALGFLGLVSTLGRPSDIRAVQGNLPKLMNTVSALGGTAGMGGALFAGITSALADPAARISTTGGVALVDQMATFAKEHPEFRDLSQAEDFNDQLFAFLKNQRALQEFFDTDSGVSFERKARGGIHLFATDPQQASRKIFEEAYKASNISEAELITLGRQINKRFESSPEYRQAQVTRQLESSAGYLRSLEMREGLVIGDKGLQAAKDILNIAYRRTNKTVLGDMLGPTLSNLSLFTDRIAGGELGAELSVPEALRTLGKYEGEFSSAYQDVAYPKGSTEREMLEELNQLVKNLRSLVEAHSADLKHVEGRQTE